jgi:hypothetical protein
MKSPYPVTPDGRYFVVKGRLWRCSNPSLPAQTRQRLVGELMRRGERRVTLREMRTRPLVKKRVRKDEAKRQLGERGPFWWDHGAPDWSGSFRNQLGATCSLGR